MTRSPSYNPSYNPKRDGPIFAWILRAAAQVREQRRLQLGREYPVLVEARRKYLPRREEG
jgi:hypothetical protein